MDQRGPGSLTSENLPADIRLWHSAVPADRRVFFGDDDRRLKQVQNESYPFLVQVLYDEARRRMLDAATLLGTETELARTAREQPEMERPLLRRTFRRIAAHFRFAYHSGPQMPLPFGDVDYEDMLREHWEKFFRREARELAGDDRIARAVVRTAGLGETAEAGVSEVRLADLLDERYGRFSLEHRLELLGQQPAPGELDAWRVADEPE